MTINGTVPELSTKTSTMAAILLKMAIILIVSLDSRTLCYGQHIEGDTWHNSPHCGLDTRGTMPARASETSPADDDLRISDGFDAADGQYPYFAQLVETTETGRETPSHACGAVIITPRVLLTAGHCLHDDQTRKAFAAGRIKAAIRSTRSGDGQLVSLAHFLIHPDYISFEVVPALGDLALVFTSHNITGLMGGQAEGPEGIDAQLALANTVCMPDDDDTQFGEYVTYETMGYGIISKAKPPNIPIAPYRLQAARVRPPSPTARRAGIECGVRNPISVFCRPERHILIYNTPNSRTRACAGDSGSPLVSMQSMPLAEEGGPRRATLAGIHTRGRGDCNTSHTTTVFMRVPYFMPWIREEVNKYLSRTGNN